MHIYLDFEKKYHRIIFWYLFDSIFFFDYSRDYGNKY